MAAAHVVSSDNMSQLHQNNRLQWRIQELQPGSASSQGGCANLLFCKFCMKMKEYGPRGGVPPQLSPPRSTNEMGLSPIPSILYTVTIGTILNNNGGNNEHGLKRVESMCKQTLIITQIPVVDIPIPKVTTYKWFHWCWIYQYMQVPFSVLYALKILNLTIVSCIFLPIHTSFRQFLLLFSRPTSHGGGHVKFLQQEEKYFPICKTASLDFMKCLLNVK